MVLVSYSRAFQSKFASHKKIAKITFPVWLYVAVTGVIVYLMIIITDELTVARKY